MKRCIPEANLEGLIKTVIKTVYHFVDSPGSSYIPKKDGLTKKEGKVLEVVLPGRGGQMTYFGEGRVCLGARGRGKLYRLIVK